MLNDIVDVQDLAFLPALYCRRCWPEEKLEEALAFKKTHEDSYSECTNALYLVKFKGNIYCAIE